MAKKPDAQPPVAAVPNQSDMTRALMLFAETLAAPHNASLTQQQVVEYNMPMLGWTDVYVAHDEGQKMLAFGTTGSPGCMLDATSCGAAAAFFAHMAQLLREGGR